MTISMSVPDIHTCIKLCSENEDLKKKLLKVKRQRDAYLKELQCITEKLKLETLLKNYVTSRDEYVQTDPQKTWGPLKLVQKVEKKGEVEKTSKLLSMHSDMAKRYEKEVKQNIAHIESINEQNIKITDLERKLYEEKEKVNKLQQDLLLSHGRGLGNKSKGTSTPSHKSSLPYKFGDDDYNIKQLKNVQEECDKMRKENKRMRSELKGLDEGFFEEVEDLKFGLQQSAKLNKEYEQTLQKFCKQFGVPYPHPEKVTKR